MIKNHFFLNSDFEGVFALFLPCKILSFDFYPKTVSGS